MILFSNLTDFSYFSVKKKFRKLQDTVRTGQNDLVERGCRWFQLFSLIFSYFIFYPESSLGYERIFLCYVQQNKCGLRNFVGIVWLQILIDCIKASKRCLSQMMNECEGDMFLATITLINFIAVSGSLTSKKDLDKNKPRRPSGTLISQKNNPELYDDLPPLEDSGTFDDSSLSKSISLETSSSALDRSSVFESSATSTGTVIIDVKVVENNTTDSEIMENNSFEELYFSDICLKKHKMGKTRIKVAMTTTILRKIVLFLVEFDVKVQILEFLVS